jgi:hypothetical protein
MVVIFIAIDPVELQQLREFRSEADFVPPLRGGTTLSVCAALLPTTGGSGFVL